MLRRTAGIVAMLLVGAIANAQPQNYAMRGTQIRAGVLLIESSQTAGQPSNATPHVWYNLDSNSRVKPAGWNIYNPIAPSQATAAIASRWALIAGVVGGGSPSVNERINKRNAAYWEVRLSQVTDAQMSQFDILLLNAAGNVNLNTVERERLRQFVDRGGVLWVEVGQINQLNFDTLFSINNFPMPFTVLNGANGPGNIDLFHPVLSNPYAFNISDIGYLNGGTTLTLGQVNPLGAVAALTTTLPADWFKLKPVVLANGAATMMVGRIGDGFMVVTSRNAAGFLNQMNTGSGYAANNQYYGLDPKTGSDKGSDTLGKLAINMINLGSGSSQPSGGSRKTSSSPTDISAPLLKRFNNAIRFLDQGQKNSFPAAAFKGIVVVCSNNQIYAYDADPKRDLDGDGNPDDGLRDFSFGSNVDVIWTSNPLAGPISAPTCVEVAQPAAGVPSDQVLVTLADGTVAAFNAFTTNATGTLLAGPFNPVYTVAPPATVNSVDTSQIGHGPYAPTIHEGLAYVATNPGTPSTGQVWMFDPSQGGAGGLQTGGQRWLVGDPIAPTIQNISAPPTVGYVPIADNSGGMDRIVYVPTRPGSTIAGPNAGIYSLWAGARGESPISADGLSIPTSLTVVTRASQRGLWLDLTTGSRGVKLTVIKANGDPLTIAEMNALFTGGVVQSSPGVLDFGLTGAWDPTYAVRIDYTVDWGRGPAASQSIVRGSIFLPDDPNNRKQILGSIAMSPRGTIYVVHSSMSETSSLEGGAFYAFREQGQGAFNCVIRYDAYRRHTVNLNQAQPVQVAATVSDTDQLLNLAPILGGTVDRLTFMTGPTVRGDLVYAAASMRKAGPGFTGFIPHTVLFAFKAEPEAPEIQVGDLPSGFSLVQPDMVRSTIKSTPTVLNVAAQGQYQYIRESGKIRFNSLMSPNRGQISSAFNLSQPVIVRSGGRPDQLVYPDASAGSRWSPLSWFTIFHGMENPVGPVVTGGTLFLGGASALPYFINLVGPPVLPPPVYGIFAGLNADISERDPFTITDASRPWLRQVNVIQDNGGGAIKANPNIRWPQNQGIKTFEEWALRVTQASMQLNSRTMSIAAGEGGFFATGGFPAGTYGGNGFFYGFSRADFVICDEGRLGRYDPAGNPVFGTDVTGSSGPEANIGSARGIKTLQRPARAYPFGVNELVVVDPPTNRIIRLDGAGHEVRSIDGFRMDPVSGISLAANEPLTLNNPRDVVAFTEFVRNPTGVSNPQALEYWVHYVIADSGNRRIVDLIDRHYVGPNRIIGDAILVNNERQLGVLRWHSPAEYSGKRYAYSSIARAANVDNPRQYWYIAGIGNATPTRVEVGLDTPGGTLPRDSRDGNGGMIIFNPFLASQNEVINDFTIPAIGANVYLDPATGNYDPNPRPAMVKKMSNLTSVTVRNVLLGVTPLWAVMFTDATGVYEIYRPGGPGTPWITRWMMPNEAYQVLRNRPGAPATIFGTNPLGLRAQYARRLDSGEVLITNGFVGRRQDGSDFAGEVVQVDGTIDPTFANPGFDFAKRNFGFYFGSLKFEINTLTDTRSLYQPVFADRR